MAISSQKNSRSYGSRKISKKSKKSSKKKNRKLKNNNSDTEIMMEILNSPVQQMQGVNVQQMQAQPMQAQQMQAQLSPSQFDPLMLYDSVPVQKISYEDNEAFVNVKPKNNVGSYMHNLSNLTNLNPNINLPINNLQMAQPMAQSMVQQMPQQMVQPITSVPVQNNSINQQQLLSNLNNMVQLGGRM